MSYVPGFAPDAKADWRELDTELQERVLDEMERLAVDPPSAPGAVFLTDFVLDSGNARHYVWMRYVLDRAAGTLTVTGIAHHLRRF
jgi:hypothetical protein